VYLLIINSYTISNSEEHILKLKFFSAVKNLKILKRIYIFLSDDESSVMTLSTENDDEFWIIKLDLDEHKYFNELIIKVKEF